jgi:hypothetical protein
MGRAAHSMFFTKALVRIEAAASHPVARSEGGGGAGLGRQDYMATGQPDLARWAAFEGDWVCALLRYRYGNLGG